MTKISSFAWGSMACALISGKVLAVDVNAGDYTALPAGTNVAAWYQQFSRADRFNGDGAPDAKHATSLRSNISILRLIHFTEIGGITVDPQILLPFGHVYNEVSGQSLGSNRYGRPDYRRHFLVGEPARGRQQWPLLRHHATDLPAMGTIRSG